MKYKKPRNLKVRAKMWYHVWVKGHDLQLWTHPLAHTVNFFCIRCWGTMKPFGGSYEA